MKFFRKVATKDTDLSQVQDNVQQTFNTLQIIPFLSGTMLTDISLTTSPQKIANNLAKKPQGYFITSINANATVWSTAATDTTITLQASAPVTVSLWIF